MRQELLDLDIASTVPALQVPVVFFLGRYDRHQDAPISASYFERLCAPIKRLGWFEQSAHNLPFEEPTRFNTAVGSELAAITAAPVTTS
jgi:proline iminopeptidase